MIQKKWTAITAALLLAVLVLAGFLALAAEYGTQDDPLVSLSYINNVLAPETLKKVDAEIEKKIEELNKTIDEKIASSRAEIDGKLLENIDIDIGKIINDAFVTAVAEKVAEKLPGGSTGRRRLQACQDSGRKETPPRWAAKFFLESAMPYVSRPVRRD